MSEELDYMSDEIIKTCVDGGNEVRPGLLKSHNELRQHELLKKKYFQSENKKKSKSVLEAEVLEESLRQPISSSNKGFSMLEKMGFKTGMGLGKDNAGIKEPIGINVKNDKKGLGHSSSCALGKPQKKKNNLQDFNEKDYRASISERMRQRQCWSDFRRSQRICKELDMKFEKTVAEEPWFWPDDETPSDPDSDTSDGDDNNDDDKKEELKLSIQEKLEMLTNYLRKTYFYCVWCRVQYYDEKDLEDCPGLTRDEH